MLVVLDTCNVLKWLKYVTLSPSPNFQLRNKICHEGLNNNADMAVFLL
jgi:hypothetical protein